MNEKIIEWSSKNQSGNADISIFHIPMYFLWLRDIADSFNLDCWLLSFIEMENLNLLVSRWVTDGIISVLLLP